MMTTKRVLIGLNLLVVLTLTGLVAVAGPEGKASATATAVVDVQDVFDALSEKTHVEAELKSQLEQLNVEEQKRRQDLEALKSDLEILAPGTPAFAEKQEQLEQGGIGLQAWRGYQQQKLTRERGLQIENLYRKMIDAVGRVADQHGYDVVMFKEKPVNFRGAKPEQLNALIQVRKVLWVRDGLDLTAEVTQMMNNEFNNMTQ